MLLDLKDALKNQGDSRPFTVSGSLSPESLPFGVSIVSPVTVRGTMTALGHNVALVGDVAAKALVQCGLCLKNVEIELNYKYDALLHRQGYEGEVHEDDFAEETVYFDGFQCDLHDSVAENLNLNLPMRFLCKEDCKGICPVCGSDVNESPCGCERGEDSPFSALKALITEEE